MHENLEIAMGKNRYPTESIGIATSTCDVQILTQVSLSLEEIYCRPVRSLASRVVWKVALLSFPKRM